MAQKTAPTIGEKTRKTVALSEARKLVLGEQDWFVEYLNTDTRNVIAQGLQLVDTEGESIFYDGETHHGFQVSFDQVLFLVKSRSNDVFKFTVYHKPKSTKRWQVWRENKKTGQEHIRDLVRNTRLIKGVL